MSGRSGACQDCACAIKLLVGSGSTGKRDPFALYLIYATYGNCDKMFTDSS